MTGRWPEGEPLCSVCGEEPVSCNGRCRDCEWAIESAHCGRHIWNDLAEMVGLTPYNHAPDCPDAALRGAS